MAATAASFMDAPFAIDASGRTAVTGADDHVRDLIMLVLFTAPGERVNRPEFGCGLKQLVFAPASDALAAATQQLVHGALIRWLDRVIAVESVDVAVGDAELDSADHPLHVQRHAERGRERTRQLDLESRRILRLAGKGKRVGVGAKRQHATASYDVERSGTRRRTGERDGQQCDEVRPPPDAAHLSPAFRLRM